MDKFLGLSVIDRGRSWSSPASVRAPKAVGRTVTAKIKYAYFQQTTRSGTSNGPATSAEALRRMARDLVGQVLPARQVIRLPGVTVSNFAATKPTGDAQPALIA